MKKDKFSENFDAWLFMKPEERANSNPFTGFMRSSICDWPKVTKPEIEELINEKIRYEAQENLQNMS